MKKREITNNDLEQLFNKVIEQRPLISEEQVNTLFNHLPMARSGNTTRHFFQNYLNTLMIGILVLGVVIGSIYWINTGGENQKTIIQNNQLHEVKVGTVLTDTIILSGVNIVKDKARKDTTLNASSTKTSFVSIQHDPNGSLADIYKHFDKQPQVFLFDANSDTTIVCKEGTSIKIKANSFVSEKTGKVITGKVQMEVKEYYKLSDMLLSNLSTTSGDHILETGGMLYITATADHENCRIQQGHEIEIGFPNSNKKEEMKLFNGERTKGKIDWKLANTTSTNILISTADVVGTDEKNGLDIADINIMMVGEDSSSTPYSVVEQMPEFPGGETALRKYIEQNAQYPFSALKNKMEGTVWVSCVVDRSGIIANVRVKRSLDNTLDKVAVYLVRKMPRWIPGRQHGEAVSVAYTIPVKFAIGNKVLTDEEIQQAKDLEEKIKNVKIKFLNIDYSTNDKPFKDEFAKEVNDDNLQAIPVSDVNRYLLSVTQLGWINCDRFDTNKNPRINYSILIDQTDHIMINLVFNRFKGIISGYVESNHMIFKNVPLGEKVTIVAFKTVNDQLFLAVQGTEITNKELTDLNFQPVTMELLKKEIEKLNKLNLKKEH